MSPVETGQTPEKGALHEYEVWSTYKVTGVAYVRATSAAEAVRMGLDVLTDDPVKFDFSEPHSETKMRACRVIPPGNGAIGGAR